MGMDASQARLCMLTARKADVEYGMQSIAHKKMALSRDQVDLAEEYNRALNATTLVWSNDGGITTQDLTYGLLMRPNSTTNYLPYMISEADTGRIVLDSTYARYARTFSASGAPVSTDAYMANRDSILAGLIGSDYDPAIYGHEETADVVESASDGSTPEPQQSQATLDQIFDTIGTIQYSATEYPTNDNYKTSTNVTGNFDLGDAYNNNKVLFLAGRRDDGDIGAGLADQSFKNFLNTLQSEFSAILPDNNALSKAINETYTIFTTKEGSNYAFHGKRNWEKAVNEANDDAQSKNRIVRGGDKSWDADDFYYVSVRNVIDTLLTCYTNAVAGKNNIADGIEKSRGSSEYATEDMEETIFTVNPGSVDGLDEDEDDYYADDVTESETVTDPVEDPAVRNLVDFYDLLFTGICNSGWTQYNDQQLNDKEYLNTMFQNNYFLIDQIMPGNKFQSTTAKDIQTIHSENNKETREKALAWYESEKLKLNIKEEQYDMDLQNLQTEDQAIQTEMDSVKAIIKENIQRTFNLFG